MRDNRPPMLPPKVFIIAGEPSGDALGGPLLSRLTEANPDLRITGIGGPHMMAAGLESLFPMEDLAVMGLAEVLPRLPNILRRLRETAAAIEATKPDVIVTIDSPDFSLRVAKRVRHLGIPIVHYVAPTVWAWRPGRARKLARIVDHVMTLFPFEPPYFEREGLAATFVGHPVVENPARPNVTPTSLPPQIAVLPGSRRGEIRRLMPVFGETLNKLFDGFVAKDVELIIPTLPHLEAEIRRLSVNWSVQPIIETDRAQFFPVLQRSTIALCASGTVVLELAKADLPGIVAYRVNALTALLARRLIKLDHVSLVNIIAGRTVMPEYIQERCSADNLQRALGSLLMDPEEQDKQRSAFSDVMTALGQGGDAPSKRAAEVVSGYLPK